MKWANVKLPEGQEVWNLIARIKGEDVTVGRIINGEGQVMSPKSLAPFAWRYHLGVSVSDPIATLKSAVEQWAHSVWPAEGVPTSTEAKWTAQTEQCPRCNGTGRIQRNLHAEIGKTLFCKDCAAFRPFADWLSEGPCHRHPPQRGNGSHQPVYPARTGGGTTWAE